MARVSATSAERPGRHLRRQASLQNGLRCQDRTVSPGRSEKANLVMGQTLRKSRSTQFGVIYGLRDVRRWNGPERSTTVWDGLRRDPELWIPDGDCLVHLYRKGLSIRGPSFRIPYSAVIAARCAPLLEKHSTHSTPESPLSDHSGGLSENGGYFGNPSGSGKYEIYIPAPPHYSREDSYRYHLNTRNFFAWMMRRPIVGKHLGQAMVELLERMRLFRSEDEDNLEDLLDYLDYEEYIDFREHPDYALSGLYFAEHYHLRDMWTDAFVHCTGMNERLINSTEFEPVSRVSKAFITRARLEMDIRVDSCGHQLGGFLENELSRSHLGLGTGARAQLDRFRSFLHAFYVGHFGYWPPGPQAGGASGFQKPNYRSMYFDFRNLYEYLADEDSIIASDGQCATDNSPCDLQEVTAFDKRHRHLSLPYAQPLLPDDGSSTTAEMKPRKSFIGTSLFVRSSSKASKAEKKQLSLAALVAATNTSNPNVTKSQLVRAYSAFEKECVLDEEKVSVAEGRKMRWILIYAVLQTLISVTRAPSEVRDPDNVSYHLCCQTAGTPPWETPATGHARMTATNPSVVSLIANEESAAALSTSENTSPMILNGELSTLSLLSQSLAVEPLTASQRDTDIPFLDWDSCVEQPPATPSPPPSTEQCNISASDNRYLSSLPFSPTPPIPIRRSNADRPISVLHPQPLRPSYHEIILHGQAFDDPVDTTATPPLSVPERKMARLSLSSAAYLSSPSSCSPEITEAGRKRMSRCSGSTESSEYSGSPTLELGDPSCGRRAPRKSEEDCDKKDIASAGWQHEWAWQHVAGSSTTNSAPDKAQDTTEVRVVRQESVDGFGGSLSSTGVWP